MESTKFGESLQKSFSITLILLFVAFAAYSVRFFFNNWIYLSQSYRQELLKQLDAPHLRTVLRCAHFDMLLSIIAGASCAFTGTMLEPNGGELIPILILLIFHFIADFVITLHNVVVRQSESGRDIARLFWQVVSWIINNITFSVMFFIFVVMIYLGTVSAIGFVVWFPYIWFINSVISIGITIFSATRR
jgi:hypothetical protein